MKHLQPFYKLFQALKKNPGQVKVFIGLILVTICGIIYKGNADDLKQYSVLFVLIVSCVFMISSIVKSVEFIL